MSGPFTAVQVTDRVWWVGAIDWEIREFHGYATDRGTTYNAYLVMSDRVTLIDTVKKPFREEMMSRIASVVDPKRIETIVSNHSEMDHSGLLPETIAAVEPEEVYASTNGVKALEGHFRLGDRVTAVKDGQTIDLGGAHLTFYETRMLHWPDSMVSYLPEERVLFSQDAFGQHLATRELWADRIPRDVLFWELQKYYANILLPFSPLILRALEKLSGADLDIGFLCPDHGPLYRRDQDWVVGLYAEWAKMAPKNKAVVVFDTMWHSDELMAKAVAEGLDEAGVETIRVMGMHASHRSDVATEILDAGALVAGSPTINNQMFPTMADVLCYLEGLKRKNLIGAAFGSYGWSGESVKLLEAWLDRMGVERVAESVRLHYVPDDEGLAQCRALGQAIGEALAERVKAAS